MSDKTQVAVNSMKAAQAEMVQWENRLEALKMQHQSLQDQNAKLQDEITNRRTDYELFMSAKDAEVKQGRERLAVDQAEHARQKLEFIDILKNHQREKEELKQAKMDLEAEKAKLMDQRGKLESFIIAVQRAYTLIGG